MAGAPISLKPNFRFGQHSNLNAKIMSGFTQSSLDAESIWKIKLLGGLAVFGSKSKITRFRTRKSASLLAYLAIRLSPQPREVLVELFWPEADPDAGRHNLSNALSSLRLVLEPVGVVSGSVIEADRFNVGLNSRSVSTDALEFEETLSRLLTDRNPNPDLINPLEQALNLYGGPLLPGFYDDWITPESLRLDSLFKQGMDRLTDLLLAEGLLDKAAQWGQAGLKNDPLDEASIFVLMAALERQGRYPDAIRAYRRFSKAFEAESLASPSKKLQDLALQIEARARESNFDLPHREGQASEVHSDAAASPLGEASEVNGSTASPPPYSNGDSNQSSGAGEMSRLLGDEFMLRTMTRYFGRREEVAKLAKMLTLSRNRLITITGPGGIGKTRFALEAVAEIAEGEYGNRYPFVAAFVSLTEVSDPSQLFGKVVRALSGVVQEGENPRDAVVRLLDSQPSPILILDNFEQLVVGGAALVKSLLAGSSKLRVLVTSRQRLRLEGEQVFRLASLPMPRDTISLDRMSEFPSVELFIDRARAASVDFQVDDRNIGSICRLCSIVEGVPLAIELAAARASLMSVSHIVNEVEKNQLDFLTTDYQDSVPRHQTLRATLDWSFRLLKEDSKSLLCALSLFRGGWTIEAAQAVSGLEISLLGSILTDLRDFSLITVLDNEDGLRFSMTEVIREFASDVCSSRGEFDRFAELHANYFAAFADETIPGFLSPGGMQILRRFRTEQANLLAARTWADSNRSNPINQKIGLTLIRFWLSVNWDHNVSRIGETTLTGKHQSTLGLLIPLGGPMELFVDPDELSGYLQQLAGLFEERGTTEAAGWNLVQLGYTNLGRDLIFARTAAEKGVALLRQVKNETALAHALNALAVILSIQGDYDTARSLNQESYVLLGEDVESKTYDFAVHTEGVIAFMAGDHTRGEECLNQNLSYARQTSDARSEFAALYVLGRIYNELGIYTKSLETLEKASQIFSQNQGEITYLSGYLSCFLGYSHYKLGDVYEAISLLKKSLYLFRDSKRTQGFSMTLFFLAEILKDNKQFKQSAQIFGASEMFRSSHGRALDHRELEWDRNLRTELRKELDLAFEEEFALGNGLDEQAAFNLATRAFDLNVPKQFEHLN